MKKLALCLAVPLALGACSGQFLPTEELRTLKPACAGGDAAVCSDIGHSVRDLRLTEEQAAAAAAAAES